MRALRAVLVGLGAAGVAYGGWLCRPQLAGMASWLVAGPVLHDALLAPALAVVGSLVGRLLPAPARRWVRAGLVVTGTLALLTVPLVLRPGAAGPADPDLPGRALTGLAWWVAAVWLTVTVGAVRSTRRARADRGEVRPARPDRREVRPAPADPGQVGRRRQ